MTSSVTSPDYSVPSNKAIAKAVKEYEGIDRNYVLLSDNIADKSDTVHAFQSSAAGYLQKFSGQDARKNLLEYLKDADAKFRIARNQAQQFRDASTQESNTLSHVASTQFYKSVKSIHTGWCNMIFGDGIENPARYEALSDCQDYDISEGSRIAKEQTLYYQKQYDKNKWENFLKTSMLWLAKNAHELIGLEWAYKTDVRTERLPGYYKKDGTPIQVHLMGEDIYEVESGKVWSGIGYDVNGDRIAQLFDENGRPRSYVFIEKTKVIQNNPVLMRYRLEDVYIDLDIEDDCTDPNNDVIQRQTCLIIRDQVSMDELISAQKDGLYSNVEFIGNAQLYRPESDDAEDLRQDKDDNADGDSNRDKVGLYDRYHVWLRSPISDDGKYEDGEIPQLYEAVFIGRLSEISALPNKGEKAKGSVCTMLRKNPYFHKRLPYKLVYSHDDDRAAVHMGYYNLLECNIEEQTVTMNQHIDNKTLKIKTPFIGERGNVLTRDLQFKNGNQVFWVKPGTSQTALSQMKIDDVSGTTIPVLQMLEKDANDTVGTTDVVRGEYAGSRTTGTEVLSVREQAMQPAIEKAKYVANQYFGFILRDVCDLCRQFADPSQALMVYDKSSDSYAMVNTAELYGDLDIKITSIEKFKSDLLTQQTINNFIQVGGYDRAKEFMGPDGALAFWRTWSKIMKMPDRQKIFPETRKYVEAENQALGDVNIILTNPMTALTDPNVLPKEGEMHDVHISILKPYRDRLSLLLPTFDEAKKQIAQLSIQAFDLYIMMHEQFKAQEGLMAEQAQQQQGMLNQSNEAPAMEGEASGDVVSGMMGGQQA